MKVLVAGGRGQLGRSLAARSGNGIAITCLGSDALDVRDDTSIRRVLAEQFDVVINAAGFTNVERAQAERDAAFAVNRDGAALLAKRCADRVIRLLHVSTDYVFDGQATSPYGEDAVRAPLQIYGQSKMEGEDAVREAGGIVVRTSWLFGEGGPSFVHSILRLAFGQPRLRVVDDQHGCPTYAGDLADALLALARQPVLEPTYHLCSDEPTTWHAFAVAIVEAAKRVRRVACEHVSPISTADYPTNAKRPAYSVLDTRKVQALGIPLRTWRSGLQRVVADAIDGAA